MVTASRPDLHRAACRAQFSRDKAQNMIDTIYTHDLTYSWPPCRADTARGTAVPCWHGTAPCRGVPPCRPCRAWPCHGPGLRPMTRHMGRFSVPCRPCATAILAVPCRPTAHQQKTLKINRKFQSLSLKLQMITCHRIIK